MYGSDVDPVAVRRAVGMVFQRPNPFPGMSVAENVGAGLRLNARRSKGDLSDTVERALRGAGLWNEVEDRLGRPGTGLSGGQQQRLCIACAIAVEPAVLLMDEPCSALDPVSTLKIEDLINELKDRYTILIVTHNMQQAGRVSDTTAFFNPDARASPAGWSRWGRRRRCSPRPTTSAPRPTSPGGSDDHPGQLPGGDGGAAGELDWLGSLAEEAVRGASTALLANDTLRAELVVAGDAELDELFVTLEQEAYHLIARQAPVAADLRFLVSSLRVNGRLGAHRWAGGVDRKIALEDWEREDGTMALLREMADGALSLVRQARRAWREKDLELASDLQDRGAALDGGYRRLTARLLAQSGPDLDSLVMHAMLAGCHIDRIADHALAVGDRVAYMVTGKTALRPAEVG